MLNNDVPLELLKQLPLFSDAPEAGLVWLAAQTRVEQFKREAPIFFQGDVADRIWLVQRGQVKIVHHDESGREMILEMISRGEVFGGGVLFMGWHPATARALEDSEVISFSRETYTAFLQTQPAVALKLIRMLGMRLHSMMGVQVLAGERVERRLAHILVKLADRVGRLEPNGILLTIALSRQDLAEMTGTTLETTIRTMSRFREQKLLQTLRGGYLLITNIEALRQMALHN